MKFNPTNLSGAWLINSEPVGDERGCFERSFCVREFAQRGLMTSFVQHSRSRSLRKGTLRGMHFQRPPHEEVKIVTCLRGAIWDVIIDLRQESPTFRRWQSFELTADSRDQLYVPAGFAHGLQTLCDDAEVGYLISCFYVPEAATGLRYDDPAFAIDWPLPVSAISAKDRNWPEFEVADLGFPVGDAARAAFVPATADVAAQP